MSDIRLELDLGAIEDLAKDVEEVEKVAHEKVALLAAQTHLHIKEEVQRKLHTRREMYDKALSKVEEVSPGVWVITLKAAAVWIEEGMEPHSMVDDLLHPSAHRDPSKPPAKPPRTAADGSEYRIIPFEKMNAPSQQSAGDRLLTQTLRQEMKKRDIPYKAVERHPDGTPKSGLLHAFDLAKPNRPAGTEGQRGWGKGEVGKVMQGPAPAGGGEGTPLLQGVRIYQTPMFTKDAAGNKVPDLDKKGQQKAAKSILTFRVVSSKHKGIKWEYPGIEGTHFFEEAERWAKAEWEKNILPELLKKFSGT